MNARWIFRLTAVIMALALPVALDGAAQAQGKAYKPMGGSAGPGGGGPKAKTFVPKSAPGKHVGKSASPIVKKHPKPIGKNTHVIVKKKTPGVVVKKKYPGKYKHAHRRWRPGLRWRYIVVPTIIIAEDLDWCHYHRYPVSGMHYHKSVRCHRHARWDHPAIAYVEGY